MAVRQLVMITGNQYKERVAKQKMSLYMGGTIVNRFDPKVVGGINVMAVTYDNALDPGYEDLGAATSIKVWKTCSIVEDDSSLQSGSGRLYSAMHRDRCPVRGRVTCN